MTGNPRNIGPKFSTRGSHIVMFGVTITVSTVSMVVAFRIRVELWVIRVIIITLPNPTVNSIDLHNPNQ